MMSRVVGLLLTLVLALVFTSATTSARVRVNHVSSDVLQPQTTVTAESFEAQKTLLTVDDSVSHLVEADISSEIAVESASSIGVIAAPGPYSFPLFAQHAGLDDLRRAYQLAESGAGALYKRRVPRLPAGSSITLGGVGNVFRYLTLGPLGAQRVVQVTGEVPTVVAGVRTVTDLTRATPFIDAVYYGATRQTRINTGANIDKEPRLIIPAEVGNHADFNNEAVNFWPADLAANIPDYATQMNAALALKEVLGANCPVQIKVELTYSNLVADATLATQRRDIPTGGSIRIQLPTVGCGDPAGYANTIATYGNQPGATAAQILAAQRAEVWRAGAAAIAVAGDFDVVGFGNRFVFVQPARPQGALVGARSSPPGYAAAWLQTGGSLVTLRGNQPRTSGPPPGGAVLPAIQPAAVAGDRTIVLGTDGEGQFTYNLEDGVGGKGRVNSVSGYSYKTAAGASDTWIGATTCDAMYFADLGVNRPPGPLAGNHIGGSAGHIVAPSIGGANGGISSFNLDPINFFPQSTNSNGGTYGRMENAAQMLIQGIRSLGVAFATCRVHIRITFTYGLTTAQQTVPMRYIPSGGTYRVTVPTPGCFYPDEHSVASLAAALQARAAQIQCPGNSCTLASQWLLGTAAHSPGPMVYSAGNDDYPDGFFLQTGWTNP